MFQLNVHLINLVTVRKYKCVYLLINLFFLVVAAYDPLDPNGNITIKFDIMSWTPDGYVVSILFTANI